MRRTHCLCLLQHQLQQQQGTLRLSLQQQQVSRHHRKCPPPFPSISRAVPLIGTMRQLASFEDAASLSRFLVAVIIAGVVVCRHVWST